MAAADSLRGHRAAKGSGAGAGSPSSTLRHAAAASLVALVLYLGPETPSVRTGVVAGTS